MANDKDTISIETYKLWAETIHNHLLNSFACYGYLQGVEDFLADKRKISIPCKEFIAHLKYLLQSSILLNVSKLLFDKGKDVYSLENYKRIVDCYNGKHLSIKKLQIDTRLKCMVVDFRDNYIAHSIVNSESLTIVMSDVFDLLKRASEYYNLLTDDDILENCYRLTEYTIPIWTNQCKTGVWDFILLNNLSL